MVREGAEVYLKIRIKGHKGEIEAEISRSIFSYYITGKKSDAAYDAALDGLIKVYKEL